jgi:1-aminocyclopropane-1-carboxylate synthase
MDASINLYNPESNPEGSFPLNVAENGVMCHRVRHQLNQIVAHNEIPEWVLKYTSALGNPDVRKEIAGFMQRYFHCKSILYSNIGFSAGASATLEVSSFILADPGDVVVIPAPAYPMYTNDLGIKSRIERYDLQTHYELNSATSLALVDVALLESVYAELKSKNKTFKILLITTPDNPTGSIYRESQLRRIADWCIANRIHLLVNEIYALSQIDISDERIKDDYHEAFTYSSFARIMADYQSDYLHLVYALSKDFAMSGMRFGIVHSHNAQFMKAFDSVNIPHMVSNMTQWMVGELFRDKSFIENYIRENQKELTHTYIEVIETLRMLGIPYVPARGSLFVWADFSKYLLTDSKQAEMNLWMEIYNKTGVLLTPGVGFQHQKHGLFRIVHSAVKKEHLKVAMQRLENFLKKSD